MEELRLYHSRFKLFLQVSRQLWDQPSSLFTVYQGHKTDNSPPADTNIKFVWCCISSVPYTFMVCTGIISPLVSIWCGLGSAVGIATGYGMDGSGIESRWGGKIFRTYPDRPWGPPSLLYNWYRVFPGGKEWPGRDTDPSPLLVPVVMKE